MLVACALKKDFDGAPIANRALADSDRYIEMSSKKRATPDKP